MSNHTEMLKSTFKDADLSVRASHLNFSHLSRLKATIQHKIPEPRLNNRLNLWPANHDRFKDFDPYPIRA